jgi:pimeloyl-ACP methyl ester carboxylesterase
MFCINGFNVIEWKQPFKLLLPLALFFTLPSPAQIEWADYPYSIGKAKKQQVRFGYPTVPETRNSENTRNLKIRFCILKSSSPNPRKDAVIYLPGGPGQGNTHAADYFLEGKSVTRLLNHRDIVLFYPRGCGTSDPQLCYGLEDPEIINANLTGISNEEYWQGIARVMESCLDFLQAAGINTEAYGSTDIAHDVEDLRKAMGRPVSWQWVFSHVLRSFSEGDFMR